MQETLTSMFIHKIMEDLLVMLLDLEDHLKYVIPGTPTRETSFELVPSFDNVTDISNANGFTITVGKIDSFGIVSDTLNYFYFRSTSTATTGNVSGGGAQCSAGPVTLQA
jgi:hypothetical protein